MPITPRSFMNQRAVASRSTRSGVERKAADEILALVFDNETGDEVGAGDVVVIDPSNERSVQFAAAKGDPGSVVVYMGGLDGESIRCVNSGVIVRVICDGDAIIPGDLIVASATNRYGTKITAASLEGVFGTALTSKAGAVAAEVQILLSPSGFGYLSTVPTVINNWTRNAGTGKLYPAVLTDQVGIGTADPDVWFHILESAAEARIETADATDPTLSFKTTNTAHQVDVYLDENAAINLLSIGDAIFADATNRRVGIAYETAPDVTLGLLDSGAGTRIRLTADANQHAFITFTPDSGAGDAFAMGYDDTGDVLSLTDSAFPGVGRGIHLTQGALVGIGTKTVPHGGVGGAKLAIEGDNGNLAGPHIQLTTASDNYPIATLWAWTHDNVALFFDMYYDGAFKSSDVGSNVMIRKTADHLRTSYGSGVAAGGAIGAFSLGIDLDLSNGYVGFGVSPLTNVHIYEDTADTEPTVRIEQDGAGDAAIQWRLTGGQAYAAGIDNSNNDYWRLSPGTALATGAGMAMTPAGLVGFGTITVGTNVHIFEDNAETEPALRITQDGAGDAALRFNFVAGQSWAIGIDNSVNDAFIIAAGSALQTNPFLTILINGDTGLGITAPLAQLHTTKGRIVNTTRIVGDTTLDNTHHVVFCDTDGGAILVTLPAGVDGTYYRVINNGSSGNDVTIDGDAAETVLGAATQTLSDGEILTIVFETAENWW